jgi:hypothetical protein
VVGLATAGTAFASDDELEASMEEALDNLQPLLVALINADYEKALNHSEPILRHGTRLDELIPDEAKDRKVEYHAYAYNLMKNASILKTFLAVLVSEEKVKTGSKTEHFPIVATTHYGGVVNACVSCHTSFRIKIED